MFSVAFSVTSISQQYALNGDMLYGKHSDSMEARRFVMSSFASWS